MGFGDPYVVLFRSTSCVDVVGVASCIDFIFMFFMGLDMTCCGYNQPRWTTRITLRVMNVKSYRNESRSSPNQILIGQDFCLDKIRMEI